MKVIKGLVTYITGQFGQDATIYSYQPDGSTHREILSGFPRQNWFEKKDFLKVYRVLGQFLKNSEYMKDKEILDEDRGVYLSNCNFIFGQFLYQIAKQFQTAVSREISILILLLRKMINEKGMDMLSQVLQGKITQRRELRVKEIEDLKIVRVKEIE